MPKDFSRTQRVADLIQQELAPLLREERENLPSQLVTISRITLSRDLLHAKVFITVVEEDSAIVEETLKILNEKAPEFRHELAHKVNLRVTPRLRFLFDSELQYSNHLSALISKVVDNQK